MTFLVIIIILALIFDYINGFHDAANSIATIVSTKVLTPFQAVLWAALFNFAAFFISKYLIGEFKIGNTIANSVNKDFITLEVIFSGLIGAIAWNLLTWWFGIPSSSSHTLLGGFMGAAIAHAGALCKTRSFCDQLCQSDPNFPFHFSRTDYRNDHRISYYDYHCKYLPEVPIPIVRINGFVNCSWFLPPYSASAMVEMMLKK